MDISILLDECLQCKDPKCTLGCPAHNDIKEFIRLSKLNKFDEALSVINKTSTLPSVCSIVCSYTSQCENSCVKNKLGKPVKIHEIENYISNITDIEYKVKDKCNKKVALIGSGPSSLSCAERLVLEGFDVTIFDKYDIPGGILTYGIPDFVLDKSIVIKKIQLLKDLGVKFILNTELNKDIFLPDLEKKFDAIFLGFGASIPKFMGIEGENLDNVIDANYFLEKTSRGEFIKDPNIKDIIVVGGGNTAIDCARRAVRYFSGSNVTICYRRSEVEMPARKDEIDKALSDGVKINYLTNPIRYIGKSKAQEVELIKMKLGEVINGRRSPVEINGSEYKIKCDLVILAISSSVDNKLINGLETTKYNTLIVNEFNQTSNPKIFSGGDLVNGPSTVVKAMADGINASKGIIKNLSTK